MLLKSSLLLILISTIVIISYGYFGNNWKNSAVVVEITDKDFADENLNGKGEVSISDSELQNVQTRTIDLKKRTSQTYDLKNENAVLTVSYDDYGNKTEKKVFKNDPRIEMIMVRTPVRGDKQVYIYAVGGKVENVPANMLNTVLSISPDKIAAIVKIYETRDDLERRKNDIAESKQRNNQQNQSYDFGQPVSPLPEPVFPKQSPNPPNNAEVQPTQPDSKREQISENQKSPAEK